MTREILKNPNPILRKKSTEIDIDKLEELQQLFLDMEETMMENDGAGLAAPQIGENIRAFVISHDKDIMFFINPQITKRSWAKKTEEEGCLSVVDEKGDIIYGKVERHRNINCVYYNEKGEKKKIAADKMLSRVIQHELDHLDGVLFIDRIKK